MVRGAAFRRVNVILGHIEDTHILGHIEHILGHNKRSGEMECEAKISNLLNTATLRLILELNLGFHASRRMPVYLERIQRTAAEMIQGLENKPHDVRLKGAQLTQLIEKTMKRGLDLSLKGLVRFADKGIAVSTEVRQIQSWKCSF